MTVTSPEEAAVVYVDVLGEITIASLNRWAVRDQGSAVAMLFVRALQDSVKPRDALEEMLVLQMAFIHARIARLSVIAIDQDRTKNVQVVNDACDRAANTFRRLMLTLNEYRNPGRPKIFPDPAGERGPGPAGAECRKCEFRKRRRHERTGMHHPRARGVTASHRRAWRPSAPPPRGRGRGCTAQGRGRRRARRCRG